MSEILRIIYSKHSLALKTLSRNTVNNHGIAVANTQSWSKDTVTGRLINRLIVGVVLMALMGGFFPASVMACENTLTMDAQCICASHAACGNSVSETSSACMNMPASSGCGCSISSGQGTNEIPAVEPVTTRVLGIDSLVATLPEQIMLADRPEHNTWVVPSAQIIHDFLYSSSTDGRAPPV